MKRLRQENINSPSHFDRIWQLDKIHYFDRERLDALVDGYVKHRDAVLDLGAGMYGFGEYLARERSINCRICAVDFSPFAVGWLKGCGKILAVQADALRTPFRDASFDVVGAGELLEHMQEPAALAAEMARLTKLGGWMIVSTLDADCKDAVRHGPYPEHIFSFEPQDLTGMFSPYGWPKYSLVGNYHMIHARRA